MDVYLVVFDRGAVQLSEQLFADVRHYVDTFYVPTSRRSVEEESQWMSEEERSVWMPENSPEPSGGGMPAPPEPLCSAMPAPPTEPTKPAINETFSASKKTAPKGFLASKKGGFRPQSMPAPVFPGAVQGTGAPKSQRSLQELLARSSETFSQMLLRLIDEKGYTDVEVYKRANMDRKLFSKIRSNKDYHPKKATVFALAIALRLSVDEATDLLRKAGYTFSDSYKQDVIVRYFLERGEYDLFTINETLFCFEEPLLGA